jgi:hypothetical protein
LIRIVCFPGVGRTSRPAFFQCTNPPQEESAAIPGLRSLALLSEKTPGLLGRGASMSSLTGALACFALASGSYDEV